MISGPLLLRADANIATGTGHVMRCLALAQAWQDAGGQAIFAMAGTTPAVTRRLQSESCDVVSVVAPVGSREDSAQVVALARERGAGWVVVDGYQFGSDYQQVLKASGLNVAFVDDYGHATRYSADLVVNQNVCADENLYQNREPYTRLFLGARYSMLRREFGAWRAWQREVPPVARKLLVTMGGSDPENVTGVVLEALRAGQSAGKFGDLETTVVVGGSGTIFESLEPQTAGAGGRIKIERDTSKMAQLMADSDVAISAAGSTCWELCLLALPSILLDVAANQTPVARELNRRECAIHLGSSREVSAGKIADQLEKLVQGQDLRRLLARNSRSLVDGNGARRVASILGGGGVFLRRATGGDSRLLWEWANDPAVRSAAFSSSPISWETHEAWFAEKLRQEGCLMLIAEDGEGSAVGQIRFDTRADGDCEVDVSVAPARRGQGLAATLIRRGAETVLGERTCLRIHAFVKPENRASRCAFESAGFRSQGEEEVSGHRAAHYVCAREQTRV
ncbi:MAG TPA: UDP-2,4-diacetamido-2,4,6-trideoxy-beta-L-altropyranose hydrolase [Candidatus Sulfotelmatobacter sp.]|nr:UDP-2,4-diacetamido-2,4,6-trideoxy-beta-L-altropyranose hydrolase [Candidatus Sulfotelmatobacter sp.]